MGLDFAIDQLYSTGWTEGDPKHCSIFSDGRSYPRPEGVQAEFAAAGYELSLRQIQLFDCCRAEWRDASGSPVGAVVGHTEEEAAVYALSQLRRSLAAAPA